MDPAEEAKALDDYHAAGIQLHAVGTVYFPKDEDDDIRSKFEYCKRAGVSVIVAGDPAPATLPRIEKFVKEYDIRFAIHNHGPEDKLWHSPLDVLKAVGNMDPRMGCCIDMGTRCGPAPMSLRRSSRWARGCSICTPRTLPTSRPRTARLPSARASMPMRRIFETLIATKYKGFVDLEYEVHGDDPMPGVIASFAYMRGVLAGMGYAK